jgi:HK97 family phage major capsid protein
MDIQALITKGKGETLAIDELRALAGNPAAFGDDVVELFAGQAERRAAAAGAVLQTAETEQRDLLASEQRSYDKTMREAEHLRALQRDVEARTAQRTFVPRTQAGTGDAETRGGLFGTGVELRALGVGAGAGAVIAPDQFSANFFDRLAPISVLLRAGVQPIRTERDAIRVPRVNSDPTGAFTAEGDPITPSDPSYTELVMTPVKLAALTVMSNELIADSNPDVVRLVEMQILRALALRYDLAAFEANEAEFKGLKNVADIQLDSSLGADGDTPDNLDIIAEAITKLQSENANATAIFMHPRTWGTFLKIKELVADSNKSLLQDSSGSGSDGVRRALYGVPVYLSSQLSITETKGLSVNCSSIYVVDAPQIVPVFRADARIELDRSRLFNSDQSELRGIMRATLAVPNPKAVVRVEGVRP